MTIMARARLTRRSEKLQTHLLTGNNVQIIAARELLRLSIVEMHELGYWREHPDQFKMQMRLYGASAAIRFNERRSRSVPDKKARHIP